MSILLINGYGNITLYGISVTWKEWKKNAIGQNCVANELDELNFTNDFKLGKNGMYLSKDEIKKCVFVLSILDQAPEDRECWQSAVILIRTTNHKWPYKLSLTIHCKFSQSHHVSLFVTVVLTTSISNAVRGSRIASCVTGKGHQNKKIQRPIRFVHCFSNVIHV